MTEQLIEIHTSDRQLFKRCRRKFGWSSTLRDNFVRTGPDQRAFFIGTGFHFALEDYWGYKRFDHPALAFAAYYEAQKRDDLPEDSEEALDLATGMLMYYADEWLVEHPEPYETLWVNNPETGFDEPQVEVEVRIRLNEILLAAIAERRKTLDLPQLYEKVERVILENDIEYVTTYDRVAMDRHERILGIDYKTAAQFDELNLQTNPQSGAYNWSMDLFYTPLGFTVRGIVWQQFKKTVPEEPKLVYVGKKNEGLSVDLRQSTTHRLFLRAVKAQHNGLVPDKYLDFLAILGNTQDESGDRFVRREILQLNQHQREAEQRKIIQEVLEMLDPDLPLYPNPTKDCSWDCPFKEPCLAIDDGSDFKHLLDIEFTQWKGYKDDWRKRIKYPSA